MLRERTITVNKKPYWLAAAVIVVVVVAATMGLRTHEKSFEADAVAQSIEDLKEYQFSETREIAAKRLGDLGPAAQAAVPYLLKALDAEDSYVRRAAFEALGKIGPTPESVSGLVAHLKTADANTVVMICEALAALGPGAQDAVPDLESVLEDEDARQRVAAAEALWKITDSVEPARSALIVELEAESQYVRNRAMRVLGEMGPAAREALPILKEKLKEAEDPADRGNLEMLIKILEGEETEQPTPE